MYYFDTLPVHPSPKPGESLSSLLARVGQANGFKNTTELATLLGVSRPADFHRNNVDLPPVRLGNFAQSLAQTQDSILRLTFHPLAVNFGRQSDPRYLAGFLSGAISREARFCPLCLQEDRYYRLSWRLLQLHSCPIHHCELLGRCPMCDGLIPLLSREFAIGMCPSCGQDLSQVNPVFPANPQSLEQEKHESQAASRVLAWDSNLEIDLEGRAELIRRRLRTVRLRQRKSLANVAAYLEAPVSVISSIEVSRGYRAGSYVSMMRYAEYLGLTIENLLREEGPEDILARLTAKDVGTVPIRTAKQISLFPVEASSQAPISHGRVRIDPLKEGCRNLCPVPYLANQVDEALNVFKKNDWPISRKSITHWIGRKNINPRDNKKLAEMLQRIQDERLEQIGRIQTDRAKRIREAIPIVIEQKGYLSLFTLAKLVKIPYESLRRSPDLKDVIREFTALSHAEREMTASQVFRAIDELKAQGIPISQTRIAKRLGVTIAAFRRYPEIRMIFVWLGLMRDKAVVLGPERNLPKAQT
jgi:transcriptional regulator with XRE-family HTH domain